MHTAQMSPSRARRRAPLAAALLLAAATGGCAAPARTPPDDAAACVPAGAWLDPATRRLRPDMPLALADRSVVLLGEAHDDAEQHRWQLHTIAALQARRPDMAIGFEMFPRRAQPVLDRWSAGALDEAAFLRAVEWDKVWGGDPQLYMPLFHFARMHRLPMIALNVDRELVRRVSREGWAAVPAAAREGVGDPAPASARYRDRLLQAFAAHGSGGSAASPAFARFLEAQLVWDRAMAEALADARQPLIVGIMGRGHVEHGDGVAHQLAALGVHDVATALPWPASPACPPLDGTVADVVFGIAEADAGP